MKMNTLPKLLKCLKESGPEITLSDELIERAKIANRANAQMESLS